MNNPQRRWNHLLAFADGPARALGGYTAYQLRTAEYVGKRPDERLTDTVAYLKSQGYRPNPLAAAKYHPAPHQAVDHGSYRRVPDAHPEGIDAELTRDWAPRQTQFHVHLFPVVGGTEIYSHYELRPDILRGDFNPRRWLAHYRPTHGETYLPGVSDLQV